VNRRRVPPSHPRRGAAQGEFLRSIGIMFPDLDKRCGHRKPIKPFADTNTSLRSVFLSMLQTKSSKSSVTGSD
jgi:hypothetical protein